MFDYRCVACGVVVTASARSKKEAKQEVARLMLQQLSRRGLALAGCAPDLVFAAEDAPGAAEAALRYMRRALLPEEPPADPDDAVS
ncbi:hypothetical protein B5X24_HaOG206772 [Helicoverpa armigera]|uniref:DRBM domain-containing protein n=1 Tax=Helicoverpa armigera TaxID=29058 RepID=A0A2W1BJ67_HELAM|nr:hypothetical protein B5X24_HaOG206772 [Helicoverpa armigera]